MYPKYLTLILFCFGIISFAFAQCPTTDITFTTQAQIDNFATTYPGCNMIPDGVDVVIDDPLGNITNLDGLSGLTAIEGNLRISGDGFLTDIDGLSNLTSVGGNLRIIGLANIDGLSGLVSVGGNLETTFHGLANVDGLSGLTFVGEDLLINFSGLVNLDGLSGLAFIGGGLFIQDNPQLSMCCALCPLLQADADDDAVIGGGVGINNNATGCNNTQEVETTCVPLPIEMIDPLRVYLKDKTAILEWRTALEINNSGFEIQRSKDGIEWEKIGWQTGQGNTSTAHRYTYTDSNPLSGTSYYRLRQVDFNGDTEYSNIVSLRYIHNGVTIYPNPVKERFYLDPYSGFVEKITIYNSTGSQITEIANPDTEIDVSELPKGIYVLKISVDDEDFYEKILVE